MAKLCFNRSGTTYSSLLAGSSSGLLVNTGGVTLGASATTGSVPVGGNYLKYSKGGSTYNVFLNNNYTTWTALTLNLPTGITCSFGSFVYAKSLFVVLTDDGAIYTSPTGTGSWTLRLQNSSVPGGFWGGPGWLTFFGGRFFARGSNYNEDSGNNYLGAWVTSFDGITWVHSISNIIEFTELFTYDGTTSYVGAAGTTYSNGFFWKSTDEGATYTPVGPSNNNYIPLPNASLPYGIFKFAGSYYSIYNYYFIKIASNWLSWDGVGGTNPLGGSAFYYYLHNTYYSNEKMLIFPYNTTGTTYYYSNDLVNWTTGTWPYSYANSSRRFWNANGLTYMNNGTSTTNCYVTVDGINWTLVSMTGGVTPYNSVSQITPPSSTGLPVHKFLTLHQAGQIGVFSGVNKLMMGGPNSSYTAYTIYVSDGT
jgi:hypothetical protein